MPNDPILPSTRARVPDGLRVYCVGDVHGQLDLLDRIAEWIGEDAGDAPDSVITVFLGDYIDRGPDSFGVIDKLVRGDFPTPVRALRGNHEQVMLDFLDDASTFEHWGRMGGVETLRSYGVDVATVARGGGHEVARARLLDVMPLAHREFFENTEFCAEAGDYFFCHAGIRPGVPLDAQAPHDLMWIRAEFLNAPGPFAKRIVHGHTPVPRPVVLPDRVNIDTGAYASGTLTCMALERDTLRIYSVSRKK